MVATMIRSKILNSHTISMMSLTAAVLIWSSSFVAMKIALRAYDPMLVMSGRMVVASLIFICGYNLLRKQRIDFRDVGLLLLMAFCEPCLYFLFEVYALVYTSASQAGMVTATLPLMVAVGARFLFQEKLTRLAACGFLLSFGGVVWLSYGGREDPLSAPNPLLGNFLEVVAMLCACGYILSVKQLSKRYGVFFLTAFQAFVGALFFLLLMGVTQAPWPEKTESAPLWAIVYLGGVVTVWAYGFYNFGVSRVPAGQASIFINLIPVCAVFWGWVILGETFTLQQYLASTLVMFGVYLSQRGRPPQ